MLDHDNAGGERRKVVRGDTISELWSWQKYQTYKRHLKLEASLNTLAREASTVQSRNPWEHMLGRDNQPRGIALAIRETWSQLTTTFQDIRIPTPDADRSRRSYLLTQEINQAGFCHEGTQPKSVTRAITTEIETARGKQLTKRLVETLPKEDFERQALWTAIGWVMYFYTHHQIVSDTWRTRHYEWDLQDIWASHNQSWHQW